jgi:hypothetical protein
MVIIGSGTVFLTRLTAWGCNVSHPVDLLEDEICLFPAGGCAFGPGAGRQLCRVVVE